MTRELNKKDTFDNQNITYPITDTSVSLPVDAGVCAELGDVFLQRTRVFEASITSAAGEGSCSRVHPDMQRQLILPSKHLGAIITLMYFPSTVELLVHAYLTHMGQPMSTLATLDDLPIRVVLHVDFQ